MNQLKVFLTSFSILIYSFSFAQIAKGNYNLGGEIDASSTLLKGKYRSIIDLKLELNPSINKFITDKWLLGIRPIVSANHQNGNFSDFQIPNSKYPLKGNSSSFGLEISNRYYLQTKNKFKTFIFLNASFDRKTSDYLGTWGNYYPPSNNYLNYHTGIGANLFFNSEIALEGTFSYAHRETNSFSDPFTTASSLGTQNFTFDFKINHFINLGAQKDKNEAINYIKKGRLTLGGHVWIGNIHREAQSPSTTSGISPQYSQFITNQIMIMGDFTWLSDIKHTDQSIKKLTIGARYYLPMKKRFFIYPEIKFTHSTGENNYVNLQYPYRGNNYLSTTHYYKNNMNLGLGGSYFLSENVAFDVSFWKNSLYFEQKPIKLNYFISKIGINHVGLIYFIR